MPALLLSHRYSTSSTMRKDLPISTKSTSGDFRNFTLSGVVARSSYHQQTSCVFIFSDFGFVMTNHILIVFVVAIYCVSVRRVNIEQSTSWPWNFGVGLVRTAAAAAAAAAAVPGLRAGVNLRIVLFCAWPRLRARALPRPATPRHWAGAAACRGSTSDDSHDCVIAHGIGLGHLP